LSSRPRHGRAAQAPVIAGLDPAIHRCSRMLPSFSLMDARVEPGHDERTRIQELQS
jgi:hypothetical protein